MNSKLSIKACVVVVVGSLGIALTQVAVAQPAGCRSAFACETNNDFGDCVATTSLLGSEDQQPSKSMMAAFDRRATVQVAVAVAQRNSAFAANYVRWLAKNGTDTRVAIASNRIQCLTFSGPAIYLCQPEQGSWVAVAIRDRKNSPKEN